MSRKFIHRYCILITTLLLFTAQRGLAEEKTPLTSQAEWKSKMQSLYQSLTDLLNDVCSDQRYFDPKNSSRIEKEIKSISKFSHELNKNTKSSAKVDPTLKLFSGVFAQETDEAYRSFKGGQLAYARDILRSIPGNCLSCHSRNALGPDFATLPLEPTGTLKPIEKATFYAATRQFDRSIETFQSVIRGQEKVKADTYELEKAVRDALMIAVRFKKDTQLAKSITQSTIANSDAPKFLKEDAGHWKKSIESWESETSKEFKTEEALYGEALRLIKLAKENQTYTMDHSEDVNFLRASSVLFDLVQLKPDGKHVSEALMLLGMCYEVLSPRRMENLHNIYYEACIQHSPHSEMARTCYHRYEQSIFFGFTGSSGTHIPQDIKTKLAGLWALAQEKKSD